MKWALDYRGEHIKAGSDDAERASLRCPACKRRVYHRQGPTRQAHFAHFSGNSNQECELYYPGMPDSSHNTEKTKADKALLTPHIPSLGGPALVWLDGAPIPTGLTLRIPKFIEDPQPTIYINSTLGQRKLSKDTLNKITFSAVSLNVPPATVETRPYNHEIVTSTTRILQDFKEDGNFFRAHSDGGVLIARNVALELGETYFILTQRQLSLTRPNALEVISTRVDNKWTAYQVCLRDNPESREEDIIELASYLGRVVIPARQKLDILWPPPITFDADGAGVYETTTSQLIVRCNAGLPSCITTTSMPGDVKELSDDLFSVSLPEQEGDILIGPKTGNFQLIRIESRDFLEPEGVIIKSINTTAGLHTTGATEAALESGAKIIQVPTQRLWRQIRINTLSLPPPYPLARTFETLLTITELDAGAFGQFIMHSQNEDSTCHLDWYKKFEFLILNIAGRTAFKSLAHVYTKGQLLSWSSRNRTQALLPIMMYAFKTR